MRVLLTNITLASRTGTEVNVRDIAMGLLRRGHRPTVFSRQLGEMADEIRAATVPVVSDLEQIGEPPDLIQGNHALETVMAVLRFPGAPALFFCHDWSSWFDEPPLLARIRRYVAVDETTRDRLILENGLPEDRVRVLHNAVDLRRFLPRGPLPPRPARGLVFSNYMTEHTGLTAVREACGALGICLDVIGAAAGSSSAAPERVLVNYDLVFAKARCALESLAVGAAVVLCDRSGAGPLVRTENFDRLRSQNFGRRALQRPATVEHLVQEIGRYDPHDAGNVSRRVRAECDLEGALDALEGLYRDVLGDHGPAADPADELREVARLLARWSPRLDYPSVRAERDELRTAADQLEAELRRSEQKASSLSEERDRLRTAAERREAELRRSEQETSSLSEELAWIRATKTWRGRDRLIRIRSLAAAYRAVRAMAARARRPGGSPPRGSPSPRNPGSSH